MFFSTVVTEGVAIIRAHAFDHCTNLKKLTLPECLIGFEGFAFHGIDKIDIMCYAEPAALADDTFPRGATIHVRGSGYEILQPRLPDNMVPMSYPYPGYGLEYQLEQEAAARWVKEHSVKVINDLPPKLRKTNN